MQKNMQFSVTNIPHLNKTKTYLEYAFIFSLVPGKSSEPGKGHGSFIF